MTAQENITKLFAMIESYEELKDKEKSIIFMPNHFAIMLEREMGIKDIKRSGMAGYEVQYGPFKELSCYNREKGVSVSFVPKT